MSEELDVSQEPDEALLMVEAMRIYAKLLKPGVSPDYNAIDRYRDFRSVFSTDAGKRVLGQIFGHCEGSVPAATASHAELVGYVERRKVWMQIFKWAADPPREPPVQQKR